MFGPFVITPSPAVAMRRPFAASQIGWFGSDLVDAASDVLNAIVHPADTIDGAWNILAHPARSVSDFADACTTVLHVVPGMDWLGEQLKDFARTSFGASMLQIVTSVCYAAAAPYVGAQLAAATFALPGIARKESFTAAFTKEFINRITATISWFLQNKVDLKVVGDLASKEGAKFLSDNPAFQDFVTKLTTQVSKATAFYKDKLGADLAGRLEDGVSGAIEEAGVALAAKYGMPPDFEALAAQAGTRADMAASSFDLVAGTDYATRIQWDPASGRDRARMTQDQLRAAKSMTVQEALAQGNSRGYVSALNDGRTAVIASGVARGVVASNAKRAAAAAGNSARMGSFGLAPVLPVSRAVPSARAGAALVPSSTSTSTKVAVAGGVAGLALLAWALL